MKAKPSFSRLGEDINGRTTPIDGASGAIAISYDNRIARILACAGSRLPLAIGMTALAASIVVVFVRRAMIAAILATRTRGTVAAAMSALFSLIRHFISRVIQFVVPPLGGIVRGEADSASSERFRLRRDYELLFLLLAELTAHRASFEFLVVDVDVVVGRIVHDLFDHSFIHH
jgi:hypothetical protein